MLFIWGYRRSVQQLAVLTFICHMCRNPAAQVLRKTVTKFTFFFVPLFTLRTRYFVQCTFCGASSPLTEQQASQLRGQASMPPPASAQQPYAQPYQIQQAYAHQHQIGQQHVPPYPYPRPPMG